MSLNPNKKMPKEPKCEKFHWDQRNNLENVILEYVKSVEDKDSYNQRNIYISITLSMTRSFPFIKNA